MTKFLISLNSFRLLSAVLKLKIETFVMLLCNMHFYDELCNNIWMIIICLHCHCIETFIFFEQFAKQHHILYRVSLSTQKSDYLWIIVQKQFSICLCFAIIINKFQKQFFLIISLNVQCQCFSHEQLYVALFQVTDVQFLYLLKNLNVQKKIQNVVYSEVLFK